MQPAEGRQLPSSCLQTATGPRFCKPSNVLRAVRWCAYATATESQRRGLHDAKRREAYASRRTAPTAVIVPSHGHGASFLQAIQSTKGCPLVRLRDRNGKSATWPPLCETPGGLCILPNEANLAAGLNAPGLVRMPWPGVVGVSRIIDPQALGVPSRPGEAGDGIDREIQILLRLMPPGALSDVHGP